MNCGLRTQFPTKPPKMKQNFQTIVLVLPLMFAFPFSGCGGSGLPDLVKCEGTVRWNGAPVEGATVGFGPTAPGGRSAFGITDAAGKFKATTLNDGDGIAPGEYVVTIRKKTSVREMPIDGPRDERGTPVGEERIVETHFLPKNYSNRETSGLSAVIPLKGDRNLTFELVGEISN